MNSFHFSRNSRIGSCGQREGYIRFSMIVETVPTKGSKPFCLVLFTVRLKF